MRSTPQTEDRLEYELAAIIRQYETLLNSTSLKCLLKEIHEAEFLVGSRGSVGSSFYSYPWEELPGKSLTSPLLLWFLSAL